MFCSNLKKFSFVLYILYIYYFIFYLKINKLEQNNRTIEIKNIKQALVKNSMF